MCLKVTADETVFSKLNADKLTCVPGIQACQIFKTKIYLHREFIEKEFCHP